jgi:hypothetical protein
MTDEFIPNYYDLADAISNAGFPSKTGNIRYNTLIAQSGPFDIYEYGFPRSDYYYLYIISGQQYKNDFSHVLLIALKK